MHNNQRDGRHRQSTPRGRVAYEPNSLGGGCPFQAGMRGSATFPESIHEDKVRGKPEKFADHYTQATLFWNSHSATEQAHIVGAFRFELSKVQVQPIRERVVSLIANIASELAERVASALGFPVPQAMPIVHRAANVEITRSVKLSLLARPGGVGMAGMKIAILVADGVDVERVGAMCQLLVDHKATPHPVAERSGAVKSSAGADLHAEASLETAPEVLWDAVILCSGKQAQAALSKHRGAQDFLRDQYLHCKPIVSLGDDSVINAALVPAQPNDSDSGILMLQTRKYGDALATLARRQYFDREVLAKRSRHQSLGGALDWQVASEWRHPHYKRRSRDIARAGRMTGLIERQCLDSGTRHGQRDKSRCS